MDGHHGHHGHHQTPVNSTESPLMAAPTVAGTLLQAVLTTMMSHQNHHNHTDHLLPNPNPPSHFVNSDFHSTSLDLSNSADHSMHIGNSAGSGYGHEMLMYFHSGVDAIILFKEWNVSTSQGLIGSVIGIFLMAMLYEGIKFFREHMFKKYFTSLEYSSVSVLGDDGKTITEVHKVARNRMLSWPHLVQTVLHVVQMVLSYFLMLIFMTYNVWLCLGVVLGAGTGYFLFGWKKATVVDITEHCH